MSGDNVSFVCALDVGTTTIKCHIVDNQGRTVGKACNRVKLHYPEPKSVEINPDELWTSIIGVIENAVKNADISFKQVLTIGISTQRSTFTTWTKNDGRPLHNFITWKDMRAIEMIEEINNSWKMKGMRGMMYLLYLCTRIGKLGVISKFKLSSNHVTGRLLWMMTHNKEVNAALKEDNLMFGTLETWLVYKLTGGKTYVTDVSNVSATGLYDPFKLNWSFFLKLMNIPEKIFPPIVENDYNFGHTEDHIFGVPLKIGCVTSDQSASMFGSLRFKENDLKLTLGTGGFLDINTGKRIQTSLNGMYPLVGWKIRNKLTYLCEVPCHDCGSSTEWMLNSELLQNLEDLESATSIKDNGGVYFISAFSGLGPPINNETTGSGFIGISPETKKSHMVRAVLESIVYKMVLAYQMLKEERNFDSDSITVDGGVTKSDFICQMLADLTELKVMRLPDEIGVTGVAFLAGLSSGLWKSEEDLRMMTMTETIFEPSSDLEYKNTLKKCLREWNRAAQRFLSYRKI